MLLISSQQQQQDVQTGFTEKHKAIEEKNRIKIIKKNSGTNSCRNIELTAQQRSNQNDKSPSDGNKQFKIAKGRHCGKHSQPRATAEGEKYNSKS